MTQISIQLDDGTLKMLKSTAKRSHTTVTDWIKDRIYRGLKQEWPEDYFSIFGSLDEDDLCEPLEIPLSFQSSREEL
ncbi:MAG: hypothetical protein MUF15_04390 [Acidobacteria bacterium]|jgi:hypothetical protein|nr:hypothetical protein [Acidobacteriota bacterium]